MHGLCDFEWLSLSMAVVALKTSCRVGKQQGLGLEAWVHRVLIHTFTFHCTMTPRAIFFDGGLSKVRQTS